MIQLKHFCLITILCFTFPYLSKTQTWFSENKLNYLVDGYIVTNESDTVYGKIVYEVPNKLQKEITFYSIENENLKQTFTPEDIKAYVFENIEHISKTFGKTTLSLSVPVDKPIFMVAKKKGPIGYYEFYINRVNLEKLLKEYDITEIEVFTYIQKLNEKPVRVNSPFFRTEKSMNKMLKDNPEIPEKIKLGFYSNLYEIIDEYNEWYYTTYGVDDLPREDLSQDMILSIQLEQTINANLKEQSYEEFLNNTYELAELYKNSFRFNKSIKTIQETLKSVENIPEHETNKLKLKDLLAQLNFITCNYIKSLDLYSELLESTITIYGENDTNIPAIYNHIGDIYFTLADYQLAKDNYNLAYWKSLDPNLNNQEYQTEYFINSGHIYFSQAAYYEALANYKTDMEMIKSPGIQNELTIASIYDNIANCNYQMGNYEEAIWFYQRSLKIKEQNLGEAHSELINNYFNIGISYATLSQNEKESYAEDWKIRLFNRKDKIPTQKDSLAWQNIKTALELNYFLLKTRDPSMVNYKNNLISREILLHENYLFESLLFYEQIYQRTTDLFSSFHPLSASYSRQLGNIYSSLYLSTLEDIYTYSYLHEILEKKIWIKKIGYLDTEREKKAVGLYNEAINVYASVYGNKHPLLAQSYEGLGDIYKETVNTLWIRHIYEESKIHNFENTPATLDEKTYNTLKNNRTYYSKYIPDYDRQALISYQNAIISNLPSFDNNKVQNNPDINKFSSGNIINNCLSQASLRTSLLKKAEFFSTLFLRTYPDCWADQPFPEKFNIYEGDPSLNNIYYRLNFKNFTLDNSYRALVLYDILIDKLITFFINENDKFLLANKTRTNRFFAANICLALNNNDLAFQFNEKSKALILLSDLGKIKASWLKNIPDYLLAEEKKLSVNIEHYKTLLEDVDLSENNSEKNTYQDSLDLNTNRYNSLISKIRTEYPDLSGMEYKIELPALSDIQNLLDEQTAILEYLDYQNLLIITKESITAEKIKVSKADLDKLVSDYRKGILYQKDDQFVESSRELYKILIPRLNQEIKNLVIIPEGQLNTIPFEALITKRVRNNEISEADQYEYLIHDYNISYSLSAAFYYKKKSVSVKNTEGFLGIAPVFSDDFLNETPDENNLNTLQAFDSQDTTKTRAILNNGMYINPIPATETEVINLSDIFSNNNIQAKFYTHKSAKEELIKTEEVKNYKFLHLATHGFVNTREPDLSGVLFDQDPGDNEDGILYAQEIYQLRLNSDLITLSACETGLGKIVPGEGVVGLSRSFLFAGAKNLIVSYWQVVDQSTSDLMIDFYNNFINNPEVKYSNALREAKLKMIKSERYSKPFYWAPFILIGE